MAKDELVPADEALLAAGREAYGFEKVRPGVPLYFIGKDRIELVTVRDSLCDGRVVSVVGRTGAFILGQDLISDPENAVPLAKQRQAERIAYAQEQIHRAEAFNFNIPGLPRVPAEVS